MADQDNRAVIPKTWDEFRGTGLFRFMNAFLHIFGWSIVLEADDDGNITKVYPARVTYRGFNEQAMADGYVKVSKFMAENASELLKEAKS